MINQIYGHRRYITKFELICAVTMFLTLTFFFFYTFLNICFDTIVTDPPIALMVILFAVLLADLIGYAIVQGKVLSVRSGVNLCIIVFLFLSWILNN